MFGCPLRDFINATETKEADYQIEKRKITIYSIIYKWPEDTKWPQNTWLLRKVSENVSETD